MKGIYFRSLVFVTAFIIWLIIMLVKIIPTGFVCAITNSEYAEVEGEVVEYGIDNYGKQVGRVTSPTTYYYVIKWYDEDNNLRISQVKGLNEMPNVGRTVFYDNGYNAVEYPKKTLWKKLGKYCLVDLLLTFPILICGGLNYKYSKSCGPDSYKNKGKTRKGILILGGIAFLGLIIIWGIIYHRNDRIKTERLLKYYGEENADRYDYLYNGRK